MNALSQTPRALFLTPIRPARTGNGLAMRASVWLDALARDHRVDVWCVPVADPETRSLEKHPAITRAKLAQLQLDPGWKLAANAGPEALRRFGRPSACRFAVSRAVAELREEFGLPNYRLTVVLRSYLLPFAAPLDRAGGDLGLKIVDLDDDEARTHRLLAKEAEDPRTAERHLLEADLFENFEREALPWADRLTTAQARHVEDLRNRFPSSRFPGLEVELLPNAVETFEPPPRQTREASDSRQVHLLFVGNLSYPPNASAAEEAAREVLPRLNASGSRRFSLRLVGRNPSPRVLSLAEMPHVEVHADVPDLKPHYAWADLTVLPLRAGGGTRIKILEAFMACLPVVSTPLGAEGLQVEHGTHLLIGETAADLAEHCDALAESPARAEKLARRARNWVIGGHSRAQTITRLADRFLEVPSMLTDVAFPDDERAATRAPMVKMTLQAADPVELGDERRKLEANRSWYRGEHCNFNPSLDWMLTSSAVEEFILKGWLPERPLIARRTPVTTFGSCFAQEFGNHLHARNYAVLNADVGAGRTESSEAYVVRFGAGLVTTFSIRQQLEWAFENKVFREDLWHGSEGEVLTYDEGVRDRTRETFLRTEVFLITLGLSEIWYDEATGEAFWRAVPESQFDPARHKFRVSSVAENVENLRKIYSLIRRNCPTAQIVLTLSPIPLYATFRNKSCISANAVSKAILRAAIDEFYREVEEEGRLLYWPSYEVVTEAFSNRFRPDRRQIKGRILKYVMLIFEKYYCLDHGPNLDERVLFQFIDARVADGSYEPEVVIALKRRDFAWLKDRLALAVHNRNDSWAEPVARLCALLFPQEPSFAQHLEAVEETPVGRPGAAGPARS